jgi:dephospho-CoA kinase
MRVIGLTGGIASGKSTVARMLADLGAHVVDADAIAREVVAPSEPAFAEVVATFGEEFVGRDGLLDRKKLGKLVFADAEKRRALNAIVHPQIARRSEQRLAELRAQGLAVAIYEAALLVENGVHRTLDGLMVVACDEATQLRRLISRDQLSEAAARARIAAQLPLADKIKVATWVIDTRGPLSDTRDQVARAWQGILHGPLPSRGTQ